MTRKQARRRKQQKVRRLKLFKLPKLPLRRLVVPLFAIAIVTLSYRFSAYLVDQPISAITIEGPFQRVTALQIEEAISEDLTAGFFSVDLEDVRSRISALAWIDQANVARRWPGRLEITVTEQVPAAVWGTSGLLNTRGDLFVENARHVPAELPRLSGPDGMSADVARRYLEMREELIPLGLDLRQVVLDPRGAWELTLTNGVDIRLGRRDVDNRAQLFLDVAAAIVASREAEIEFVDMRYSNGFTIGWKKGKPSPQRNAEASGDGMVAGLRQ
jgi:cell division protein FtsQ